jgi:small subunit ribosomal protein S6
MIERYRGIITAGRRRDPPPRGLGPPPARFPIAKVHKAHYVLMNVECDGAALGELTENSFRFSDAVIRNMVVPCRPRSPSRRR